MKKLLFIVLFTTLNSMTAFAQTGSVGINTQVPGSTLDVNGSFAAAYASVTANTYTASENDFSIKWGGTADGTITLPVSTAGQDRSGRIYFLKNTSASFLLTVKGSGSELIDNSNTVVIDPGEALLLVKTDNNTATASTYMVLQISKTQESYTYSLVAPALQNIPGVGLPPVKLDFTAVDYSPNGGVDFNLTTDIWTCPQTGWYSIEAIAQGTSQEAAATHTSLQIVKNGTVSAFRYFFTPGNSQGLINSGSVSKVLKFAKGDQLNITSVACFGCSTGTRMTNKQLNITRL